MWRPLGCRCGARVKWLREGRVDVARQVLLVRMSPAAVAHRLSHVLRAALRHWDPVRRVLELACSPADARVDAPLAPLALLALLVLPAMVAPEMSSGIMGISRLIASSSSMRTKSSGRSMRRCPGIPVAPAQFGPITASSTSQLAIRQSISTRKSAPGWNESTSLTTWRAPKRASR